MKRLNNKWFYTILPLLAVVVLVPLLMPYMMTLSVDDIVNYVPYSIVPAILVLIAFYIVKPFIVVVPITTSFIVAGIVLPTGWALLVVILGLVISLSIGYIAGKVLGTDMVHKIMEKNIKAKAFLLENQNNQLLLCFVARVSPLPFELVSLFFGALNMPYWKYIGVSLLGLIPFMVPCVFVGTAISNPISIEFLLPLMIGLLISAASIFVYWKLQNRSVVKVCA
ncbi:MAG: VTT domain-containing protein [Lachnospiraceae bacterium]|jgi:uncharacterized membrane protein YdjX (TVP38/TMEM64 family)|nr:VTT domain-containing protein [Lachnospiraceae bacterium]